jgi:hypothetical protein
MKESKQKPYKIKPGGFVCISTKKTLHKFDVTHKILLLSKTKTKEIEFWRNSTLMKETGTIYEVSERLLDECAAGFIRVPNDGIQKYHEIESINYLVTFDEKIDYEFGDAELSTK